MGSRAIYSALRWEVNQLLKRQESRQIGLFPTSVSEFAAKPFDRGYFVVK
jgi:hypothetical protein